MRPEKNSLTAELKQKLQGSNYVFLADFTGLNVEGFGQLRERLGKLNARAMVVKNSILRLTFKELNLPELNGALSGPTAMVYGGTEPTAVAGVLKKFFKEFEKLKVKVGILDGAKLAAEQINELADLPSREVMRAQLLGLLMTPANQLVRLFNEPAARFTRVLNAKAQKAA